MEFCSCDAIITYGVRGLTTSHVQRLRHAPLLSQDKLFPVELLKELDEVNFKSLHTRALLRSVRGDTGTTGGKFKERIPQKSQSPYNTFLQDQRQGQFNRCVTRARSCSPVRTTKTLVKARPLSPVVNIPTARETPRIERGTRLPLKTLRRSRDS